MSGSSSFSLKNNNDKIFKKKNTFTRSSHRGSAETNLTSIREDEGSLPGLAQWS